MMIISWYMVYDDDDDGHDDDNDDSSVVCRGSKAIGPLPHSANVA